MVDQPLVSVVIATRNRPEMLREAIAAVVGQTYAGPVECVIVFDQTEPDQGVVSTDPHRTVRVMGNTERKPGLAGARNTGILASEGEYVAFCDDDDIWLPAKLAKQVASLFAPALHLTSFTLNSPFVRVPVLSVTRVSIFAISSR